MPERGAPSLVRRRAGAVAGTALLAGALLFVGAGCAGQPRRPAALPPLPFAREAPLDVASPAARDALEAGLRWIAADAPETKVETSPQIPPAKGGGR